MDQSSSVHPVSESRGGTVSVMDRGQSPEILVSNIGSFCLNLYHLHAIQIWQNTGQIWQKKLKKLDLLGFVEFAFSNSGLLLWNRGGLVKGCDYKFRI